MRLIEVDLDRYRDLARAFGAKSISDVFHPGRRGIIVDRLSDLEGPEPPLRRLRNLSSDLNPAELASGRNMTMTARMIASLALLQTAALGCATAPRPATRQAPEGGRDRGTTLGVSTRAPRAEEARAYGLPFETRTQGRVVETVDPGGPAEKAGVNAGDILLRIEENELFSEDDLRDFLAVGRPGVSVRLAVKRGDSSREEVVRATLDPVPASEVSALESTFVWQYAGLGQLPLALEEARRTGKHVLVGLSGAET